jgi:beta-galactosidase
LDQCENRNFMKPHFGISLTFFFLATAASTAATHLARNQNAPSAIEIDASKEASAPEPLPFSVGGRSSNGHVLSANNRYLMMDGQAWFPVMGEFHFSRYSNVGWEEEILKMKAGGIGIVSTYIFWIHHEEIEGQFDWSEQRNLRRFVELCAKHGLYVWIRVGPWAHGEVRNGGLPDWLLHQSALRQNDPVYLHYVRQFYGEIGQQVHGLLWKDGGPIIGVQIENEYHERGVGKGSDHILTLLGLAHEAGLDTPFYTATGWDGVEIPAREILPVFGGYADAFWSRKVDELPPNANYFFSAIRCDENVGDDLRSKRADIDARYASYPFLTAEMGGGMELSYHRRPLMSADDTAAMALVKVGSGAAMYGYYMFHGGTNPEGKKTTLQESQATGYPNDLPVKSYDFQAPLGEFGQVNPAFRVVKGLHLFLSDFGGHLAPMAPYFPKQRPESKQDTATPRVAARAAKNRGFVFINNYQRNYSLPERKNFQVRLKLSSGVVDIPRNPANIPSGAYTIWPVNLDIGGVTLRYATAQLLCQLSDPNTYVFFTWPSVRPEFAFETARGESITAPHARIKNEHGVIYVDEIKTGAGEAIRVRTAIGAETTIIVLSQEGARNIWKANLGGRERLILSSTTIFFDSNRLHMRSGDPAEFRFGIFPKPDQVPAGFSSAGRNGVFELYDTHISPADVRVKVEKVKNADPRAPVAMGKEVAEAPEEAAYRGAAEWSIRIPPVRSGAVKSIFLRIKYEGDVARVYDRGKLVTDDFFKGTPLLIGLDPTLARDADPELELKILPLRKDAPIYLPAGTRPSFSSSGEVATLQEVQVIPEYEAVADFHPTAR